MRMECCSPLQCMGYCDAQGTMWWQNASIHARQACHLQNHLSPLIPPFKKKRQGRFSVLLEVLSPAQGPSYSGGMEGVGRSTVPQESKSPTLCTDGHPSVFYEATSLLAPSHLPVPRVRPSGKKETRGQSLFLVAIQLWMRYLSNLNFPIYKTRTIIAPKPGLLQKIKYLTL